MKCDYNLAMPKRKEISNLSRQPHKGYKLVQKHNTHHESAF